MLDTPALNRLANQLHCSTYVVLREYCQGVVLSALARHKSSQHFIFKGGTCIRFLYQSDRFSEDLDFTIRNLDQDTAVMALSETTAAINEGGSITLKPKKSLAGQRFMLTWSTPILKTDIKIKLDLSFREKDFQCLTSALTFPRYPIKSDSVIYHYSPSTILAEKVHAIMNRTKGRDLYDIWFLISMLTPLDQALIHKKFAFYGDTFNHRAFVNRLKAFPVDKFVVDLAPFVTNKDRPRLAEIHQIITTTLPDRLAPKH